MRLHLALILCGSLLFTSCNFDNSPPFGVVIRIQYKSIGLCATPQLINTSKRGTDESFQLRASVPPSTLVLIGNLPPDNVAPLDLSAYAKGTQRDVATKGYIYDFSHLYDWHKPKNLDTFSYSFNLAFKCDSNRPETKITVPTTQYLIVQEDASQPSGYTLTVTQTEPTDWN